MIKEAVTVFLFLISLNLFIPALGQEGGEIVIGHEKSLLMPIADFVSGRAWLNLKGMDPIHAASQYKEYAAQLPGVGPVLIPFREPTAKFSRNIIVSYPLGRYPYQTEPCMAVNPTNPDNILIGLDDYNFYGDAIYVSVDGGETWEGPIAMKVFMRDEWGGNPTLAFSRDGDAYFAQMSIGYRWVRVANLALTAEVASIVVYKSTDGGLTWSDPVIAALGKPLTSRETVDLKFLDRPWMAIGPDPEDPSRDNIYVTYTEFALRYPILKEYPYVGAPLVEITIKLVRSTDGGSTFSRPVAVSPTYSYLAGEEYRRIVQGSQSAVAPDGKLYVSFYDALDDGPWKGLFAPTITYSTDGGLSFSRPVAMDYLSELDYWVPPTFFRAWPSMSPRIAVGPEGNVYAVVAANPPGPDDSDIYFLSSLEGGRTWSRSKRINDDIVERDQVFQSIAVDGNGTIHVSFIDRRDDPADVRYHIYYTKSGDDGETWTPNSRVSDYPSNPNFGIPLFIGDFFTIAVSDKDVYIAWTDTRLGRIGSPNSCIAIARTRPVSSPSIYISPPSGSAGTDVVLMGFNFAPIREVYVELEGVIITTLRTDDDGRFTTRLFIPVSGEGAHTIKAMDVSGNVAEAMFYTEFGFDTIRGEFQKSLGEIRERLSSIERGLTEAGTTENKTDIQRLEAETTKIKKDMQRLEAFLETFTAKLDGFERTVKVQISDMTTLLWVAVALAIVATMVSISTMVILMRWLRGKTEASPN